MALKKSAARFKQKAKTFLITKSPTRMKIWFLLFVFRKGQNEDKSEFVTIFAGIIVRIIFM